jgi:hypothetical protein
MRMAFYTGTCTSYDDMKTTLINLCELNGWTATTDSAGKDVIYKGNLYIMVDVTTGSFNSLGITGRTGVNEGSAPGRVGISDFYQQISYPCPGPVQFPMKYFCFAYSDIDEVYFLINYADMYQWIAFGKSNITLPGTRLWVAGTSGLNSSYKPAYIDINSTGYSKPIIGTNAALFWFAQYYSAESYITPYKNFWLHSNINPSYPWSLSTDNYYQSTPLGIKYLTTRLYSQPNEYNQQSLLLPVLVYHKNDIYSGYYTLAAHIQKARHLMINYLDPETIIYHGDEQWMVFPYLRKVYQSPYTFSLEIVDHTGNFGWAIKKEA